MKPVTPQEQLKKLRSYSEGIAIMFEIFMALVGIGLAFTLITLVNAESFQLNLGNGSLQLAKNTIAEIPAGLVQLNVLEFEKVWGISLRNRTVPITAQELQLTVTPMVRTVLAVVAVLSTAVVLNLLGQVVKLFKLYAKGEIFTQAVVQRIRYIGWAVMGFPLLSILKSIVGAVLVAQVKPDMQWLDLSINFAYFAATLVVVVISWIMDAGRKLQEENELTI